MSINFCFQFMSLALDLWVQDLRRKRNSRMKTRMVSLGTRQPSMPPASAPMAEMVMLMSSVPEVTMSDCTISVMMKPSIAPIMNPPIRLRTLMVFPCSFVFKDYLLYLSSLSSLVSNIILGLGLKIFSYT